MADINLVPPRTTTKGLTVPWDTNVVTLETQSLARGPI